MSEPSSSADFFAALSLLTHIQLNPVLGTLIRHKVPDHLDNGPLPAAQLAQTTKLHPLSLTRSLRALAGFGVFREVSDGTFSNTPISDFFRDRPGGLRNFALHHSSPLFPRSAASLGYSLETGESAFDHVFGQSFWEYLQQHSDEAETFNRMLAELRKDEHRQIAEACDLTGVNTVVDVGGGAGSLLAALLQKQSNLRGVLFDQPSVLQDAETHLTAQGVRDRCDLVGGSFFSPIQATGDAWLLSQILHDWPDRECCAILNRCRDAMRPGDRLLVVEMLTIPCQPNAQLGMLDLIMLMYFGEGRQRTLEEYTSLFASSGFALSRVLPTASPFSIVEATRL